MGDICIQNLRVSFNGSPNKFVVNNISLTLKKGLITGLVGESGSGKSILGMAILGLNPPDAKVEGEILYENVNLAKADFSTLKCIRGKHIGLIPQSPLLSMNLVLQNYYQVEEFLKTHTLLTKPERKEKIYKMMKKFGLEYPEKIFCKYPFQLSGGLRQRVISLFGTILEPEWIIADEPTKGLDAVLRRQVFQSLKEVSKKSSLLVITHDMFFAKSICDYLFIFKEGKVIEHGSSKEIFYNPKEEYTKQLLDSIPRKIYKMEYRNERVKQNASQC